MAWNEQDLTLREKREEWMDAVKQRIVPRIATIYPPLRSALELQRELDAAFEKMGQMATNRNSEARPVTDAMVRVGGTTGASS